jgi:ribosomal protein S18 acetylase RimI-like enzyme
MKMTTDVRIEFGADALLPAFCEGFNRGFADYKYGIRMDEAQMVKFMAISGISYEISAVLMERNDAGWCGAGVALVASEDRQVWCSGLAVAPPLRGCGFGRRLMESIQARVAAYGAQTIQLEVLVENAPARALYAALGYQPCRDLLFWRTEAPAAGATLLPDLHAASVMDALRCVYQWQGVEPAWQRRQQAVARFQDDLWAYRMQDGDATTGWVLCLPSSSSSAHQERLRIMALAVRPGAEQALLAQQLLASLRQHRPEAVISLLNEPDDSLFNAALLYNGFVEIDRQIEMVLDLGSK